MPELPEVETIRRQLQDELRDRAITDVGVVDARICEPLSPADVSGALSGRRITALSRRGKYLLFELDDDSSFAIHLRMTGNLLLAPTAEQLGSLEGLVPGDARLYEPSTDLSHLRLSLALDDGSTLLFVDVRRFGTLDLFPTPDAAEAYLSARLGLEPLSGDLTGPALRDLADGRTAPLKSFLLDQGRVAGIGNIYADEALHRAALHPLSPAGSMKPEHCDALAVGIVEALEAGLEAGGASIDDYRDARGERGSMQDEFLVHTREGEECPRCGDEIARIVVAGRSTYYCPSCQKRLRRKRRRPARRAT